jgi:hypothetical protein
MVGMNIGKSSDDYSFLMADHLKNRLPSKEDTIEGLTERHEQLSKAYSEAYSAEERIDELQEVIEARGKLQTALSETEEKLFYFLLVGESFDPKNEYLAKVIFEKGLDTLEDGLNRNREEFKDLTQIHMDKLTPHLNERIQDRFGAAQFIQAYPQLCRYTQENSKFGQTPMMS